MDVRVADPPHRLTRPKEQPDWVESDHTARQVAFHMNFYELGSRFGASQKGHAACRNNTSATRNQMSSREHRHFATSCSCAFGTCQRTMW
jgi:hypothetical protein